MKKVGVGRPAGSKEVAEGDVPKRSGVSGCERKPDRAQPSIDGGPDANRKEQRSWQR